MRNKYKRLNELLHIYRCGRCKGRGTIFKFVWSTKEDQYFNCSKCSGNGMMRGISISTLIYRLNYINGNKKENT